MGTLNGVKSLLFDPIYLELQRFEGFEQGETRLVQHFLKFFNIGLVEVIELFQEGFSLGLDFFILHLGRLADGFISGSHHHHYTPHHLTPQTC